MRIFVTGGAGYVGSVLTEHLLADGHEVRIVDNLRSGGRIGLPPPERAYGEFIKVDIRDADAMATAMRGCDAIIHLAAVVGYPACDASPDEAVSINVGGTETVLAAAAGRPVVVASTLSVLGKVGAVCCDETTTPRPVSLYGETKLTTERRALRYGNAVVLRPATAFGVSTSMRFDLLVNQLTREAVLNGHISVYQPEATRCFVHVRDLAWAMAFAATNAAQMRGEIYHVGNDALNLTKRELAGLIRDATTCDLAINESGTDKDERDYAGDFKKLATAGLLLDRTLTHGIEEVVEVVKAGMDGAADGSEVIR